MSIFFRQVATIIWKDLLLEYKNKERLIAMSLFSCLTILTFSFAFNPTAQNLKVIIPGLIWTITIFTALIGLQKAFEIERENDCFTMLKISPIDPAALYVGKVIVNYVLVAIVQAFMVPLLFLLFNYRWYQNMGLFILLLILGTLGFIIVGTLLSAISIHSKSNSTLLPILLLPLVSPLIMGASQATKIIFLQPENIQSAYSWLNLIIAYDAIFFVVCFSLFQYITEE